MTTLALERIEAAPDVTVRQSRDGYRRMQRCLPVGTPAQEAAITIMVDTSTRALLQQGWDVIIDATNVHPGLLEGWRDLAAECGALLEVWDLSAVPVEECIRRVRQRAAGGGRDVDEQIVRAFAALARTVAPEEE